MSRASTRLAECILCKNKEAVMNRAATIFCLECKYSVTRKKNVNRMVNHRLYKKHGYKITPRHPDWETITKTVRK
jgi:hypothetical protein